MPDNVAKVVIDASADGILRAAAQVKKSMGEAAEAAAKPGERLAFGLLKSLTTATALLAVGRGVADAFNQAAMNAAKINEKAGGNRLSAELAGQRLGITGQRLSNVLGQTGPRSQDERVGFLNALANAKGPGGRPIDTDTAEEAISVFQGGVIDQGRIIDMIGKRGRRGLGSLANESAMSIATLSDAARQELFTRTDEARAEQRIASTSGERGRQARRFDALMAADDAENPSLLADTIAKVPILGELADGAATAVLRAIHAASERTAANTRPRLNTSANGP